MADKEKKRRRAYYLTDAEAELIEHFRWELYCRSVKNKDRLTMHLCRCIQGCHFLYTRVQGEDGYCGSCRGFYAWVKSMEELIGSPSPSASQPPP